MPAAPLTSQETSLPAPRTVLVGREREIAASAALLARDDVRLLTLTGPGGSGKTRLALVVAESLTDAFSDGIVVVVLASITDPALVAPTIALALGIRESSDTTPAVELTDALHGKHLLLVLDNFEQVLPAAALVSALLDACPELTILVTSRALLRLSGEHVYLVPPLTLPDADHPASVDALGQIDAVRLFVERARAARADFALTPDNAGAVTAICIRLGGLPLAIELAAARIRMLAPQALLTRLERRLPLLTGGPRDAPARQQTMHDTIAWSYDLLSADEQRLFRQLAVFAGGWTLDACTTVADPDLDAFEALATLVDHSLVQRVEQPDGSERFGMLETIREFGLGESAALDELRAAERRHATYYLDLAENAARGLQGDNQQAWVARLDADLDNIRTALNALLELGEGTTALRLAIAVADFFRSRVRFHEGRRWLERALAEAGDAPAAYRAEAYRHQGNLAREQGAFAEAEQLLARAAALYRETDNLFGLSSTMTVLGFTALYQGKYEQANEWYKQALELARSTGDTLLLADALASQTVGLIQHDYGLARAAGEESLAHYRALGNRRGMSRTLGYLGRIALWQGDIDGAARLAAESLAASRGIDDYWTGFATDLLGMVALERGDYITAGRIIRAVLLDSDAQDDVATMPNNLECLAGVARGLGDMPRAATLLGMAENLRQRYGVPILPPYQGRHDRLVAAVRASLSADAYAAAWNFGHAMSRQAIVQFVIAPDVGEPIEPTPVSTSGLSKRETEVLRLVASGHSNKEIAALLFLSDHTVERHISNLYRKINARGRSDATAWALRRGLV